MDKVLWSVCVGAQLQAEIMGWEEGPENQDFTPDRLDLPENELQEINTGTGGCL